jgi:hypothetical protein
VFELAASGTPIVSGTSPAIRRFFGDNVLQAGDSDTGHAALQSLLESEDMRSRIALRGIRTAMRSHTASLRFDQILERSGVASGRTPASPPVSLVVATDNPERIDGILENVSRQAYTNLQLVVSAFGFDLDEAELKRRGADLGVSNIALVHAAAVGARPEAFNTGFRASDGTYVGWLNDADFYGGEFVGDIMDAFVYTEANIIGKRTHYAYVKPTDAMVLRSPGFEHEYVDCVALGTTISDRSIVASVQSLPIDHAAGERFLSEAKLLGARLFSGDRYNYLDIGSDPLITDTRRAHDNEIDVVDEVVLQGLDVSYVSV